MKTVPRSTTRIRPARGPHNPLDLSARACEFEAGKGVTVVFDVSYGHLRPSESAQRPKGIGGLCSCGKTICHLEYLQ